MHARPFALMFAATLVVFSAITGSRAFDGPDPVPFPAGFREWSLVKTGVVLEGHPSYATNGGIRHIYGNPRALAGYRSGAFDDGAIIVAEFVEGREENKTVSEGARRRVDVMVRDRTRYAATGGWGFESFTRGNPDQPRVGDNAPAMCFECHGKQTATSFVFSTLRP